MEIDGCQVIVTHFDDQTQEKYFVSIRTLIKDVKTNHIIVGQEIGESTGRAIFFNIMNEAIDLSEDVEIKEVDVRTSETRASYDVILCSHETALAYYNIANIVAIPIIVGLSDRKVSVGVHSVETGKWVNQSEVDIHALQEFKELVGHDDPIYDYVMPN